MRGRTPRTIILRSPKGQTHCIRHSLFAATAHLLGTSRRYLRPSKPLLYCIKTGGKWAGQHFNTRRTQFHAAIFRHNNNSCGRPGSLLTHAKRKTIFNVQADDFYMRRAANGRQRNRALHRFHAFSGNKKGRPKASHRNGKVILPHSDRTCPSCVQRKR